MGGGASRWRRAAKKIIGLSCVSFSTATQTTHLHPSKPISTSSAVSKDAETSGLSANKNLCAICLEPLLRGVGAGDKSSVGVDEGGGGLFTAQCWHSFHLTCIASNVRHGNVTCPICRAHWAWAHLPRGLAPPNCHRNDPILRILDDSIATSRVNRRTSLRSTRYDDDDPVEPHFGSPGPRLDLALLPITTTTTTPASLPNYDYENKNSRRRFYLSVKLAHQLQAMDLVLVASPNGPHLRLLKQAMALVIFSLRSVDRLAIVTYSSSASRAFALRRMSVHGKRTALQAIDRLFYMGDADPVEGLSKGVKILEDRSHRNPLACILHLSDSPTRSSAYANNAGNEQVMVPFPVHRFHIGFGHGLSNGFVMHEFEEFLTRLLGGGVKDARLRIGDDNAGWMRLGDLRGGEERRIPVVDVVSGCRFVCVGYSYYVDGGGDHEHDEEEERFRSGEVVVEVGEKSTEGGGGCGVVCRVNEEGGADEGRSSSVHRRDFLDPFMARRWAKHLHGYRA